ncbi:alpha-glucuronidase family glycosyl hydrolase [Flammeovirgaceae bacterium SG7u.111]|nr:alpha-glucuronidase family glycosyl hydrolase [Flammeovirgaceae bacterium SG7u.132]WPO34339.1 alpha-glucuronidase family glycosyl hydrolase [Flammeovirgaceae bacterium SG7u.111]
MKKHSKILICVLLLFVSQNSWGEDGYKLWLRYAPIAEASRAEFINSILGKPVVFGTSATDSVIIKELGLASEGFFGKELLVSQKLGEGTSLWIGTLGNCELLQEAKLKARIETLGEEGYLIDYISYENKKYLAVAGATERGALYGVFHLLRLLQTKSSLPDLPIKSSPKITRRVLNHWDNLDGTVERGYAGFSIWDWHRLPDYISPRYIDYARANASIGINGTVLTNVNANAFTLTPLYLEKVAALADVMRPYGVQVYLTARFSSPIEIGGLETADPLNPEVRAWWKAKVDEIYEYIPDFGGFLVKANSEGQPGPQNYDRSHADGANMMAETLAPHGGVVMWRAFVYSHEAPDDRAKQANNEFEPLDGKFLDNVFIQVKNGAIDFQPREPFHPLFGAMEKTALGLELQITQEYLGQGTSLAYLAPLFKECLDSDTFSPKKGTTVAKIIDGSVQGKKESLIAGVANIGTDRNWTGYQFGQANWYAYGRLAWEYELSSEEIAEEWIGQTFGTNQQLMSNAKAIMMASREAVVKYMTPLGLHHIMGRNHHYGPGPWVDGGSRPDWTSVYYHKADKEGIGFDRTASGSDALSQYAPEIEKLFSNPKTCPDKFLLWFHHLPWDYKMKSGNTLWEEMCLKYDEGVKNVGKMRKQWDEVKPLVDDERHAEVATFLKIQEKEARWWRNACLLYFQTFSGKSFPKNIEQPEGELSYYKSLVFPYAPGIKPRW